MARSKKNKRAKRKLTRAVSVTLEYNRAKTPVAGGAEDAGERATRREERCDEYSREYKAVMNSASQDS